MGGGFLEQGFYQLFRMISGYAALYIAGFPASAAFWGQIAVAGLALFAVLLGVARGASSEFTLGVAVMVSVMISPYAYDYDLPMLGIGLALALPDLARVAIARASASVDLRARPVRRGLWAGAVGAVCGAVREEGRPNQHFAPALGGFALMALLVLLLRLLWRGTQPARALPQAAPVAE